MAYIFWRNAKRAKTPGFKEVLEKVKAEIAAVYDCATVVPADRLDQFIERELRPHAVALKTLGAVLLKAHKAEKRGPAKEGWWYVGWKDAAGKSRQRRLSVKSRKDAERIKAEAELREQKQDGVGCTPSIKDKRLAELAQEYLDEKRAGWAPATLGQVLYGLTMLCDMLHQPLKKGKRGPKKTAPTEADIIAALGDVKVAALSREVVKTWREGKNGHARTANVGGSIAKRMLAWGVKLDKINANPLEKLDPLPESETDHRAFEPDELAALLKVSPPHLRRAFYLMGSVGLRRGELCGLNWSDLSADGKLTVRAEVSKSTKPRTIRLRDDLLAELKSWRIERQTKELTGARAWAKDRDPIFIKAWAVKGNPGVVEGKRDKDARWLGRELYRRFRTCLKRARLDGEDLTVHSFRYTACTQLLLANVPPSVVMKVLGHASERMTMRIYNKLQVADHPGLDALPFTYRGLSKETPARERLAASVGGQ